MMTPELTIATPMTKTMIGAAMLQRSCTTFSSCTSNTTAARQKVTPNPMAANDSRASLIAHLHLTGTDVDGDDHVC